MLFRTFGKSIFSLAGHEVDWPVARQKPRRRWHSSSPKNQTVYYRLEAATITVFQNADFGKCAHLFRARETALSSSSCLFTGEEGVKGSKLHYRAHRGNIQKRHLCIGISGRYTLSCFKTTVEGEITENVTCDKSP